MNGPLPERGGTPRPKRSGTSSAVALIAALVLAACAKRAPPSGGPPDIEPPRLVEARPDSGAARVPLQVAPFLAFSEGMEPRSSGEAISISPPVEFRRVRWSGRSLTVELAEPLQGGRTYTLLVGGSARDRHGNPIDRPRAIVFTTGDSFPPGRLEGRMEARGFQPAQATVWAYDAGKGRAPDSTGRDFDALGLVDPDGVFRVPALAAPGSYRLWVFADLNSNRSFEPETDVLAAIDTTLSISAADPVATGLSFTVVNPRAPARVRGTISDSLRRGEPLFVLAVADTDTTRRVVSAAPGDQGGFDVQLDPGRWTVRAFRDVDRNRAWDPAREPASAPVSLDLTPGQDVQGIVLMIVPAPRGP